MKMNLATVGLLPLTALMLAACVSQKASEQQTQQLQQVQAQSSAQQADGRAKNRRIEIVTEGPGA
jgi:transcription initiation factor TFIID subunit TAF12